MKCQISLNKTKFIPVGYLECETGSAVDVNAVLNMSDNDATLTTSKELSAVSLVKISLVGSVFSFGH